MEFATRFLKSDDAETLLELYRAIASQPGGFARTADEISLEYVHKTLRHVANNGVGIGVIDKSDGRLVGSIVARKLGPKVFDHVLSELTIGVHPNYQSKGVGRRLFIDFLEHIQGARPDILRVELIARESNPRAISFYEAIGFRSEGVFEKRIRKGDGTFESDIPMAWLKS